IPLRSRRCRQSPSTRCAAGDERSEAQPWEAAKVYHPRMRAPALLALFCGAPFIALSPIWVRRADVGPTASAFWRVALALPLLWVAFALAPRAGAALRANWRLLAAAGLAFAGDLVFWHWSIQFTSVANSTLLANLASIFLTLAAGVLWLEQPRALFLG